VRRRTIVAFLAVAAGCGGSSSHGAAPPPAAQQLAPGSHVARSPGYHVVAVVGEVVSGAGSSSSHYRLQGGLVGAQGTLP
jgi:hypothetical protein